MEPFFLPAFHCFSSQSLIQRCCIQRAEQHRSSLPHLAHIPFIRSPTSSSLVDNPNLSGLMFSFCCSPDVNTGRECNTNLEYVVSSPDSITESHRPPLSRVLHDADHTLLCDSELSSTLPLLGSSPVAGLSSHSQKRARVIRMVGLNVELLPHRARLRAMQRAFPHTPPSGLLPSTN